MSATCLLHLYKIPLLNSPAGDPGSPIGLCQKCGSLCCGWHGGRTSRASFLCILCEGAKLFSAAGWKAWLAAGGLSTLSPANAVASVTGGGLPAGASDDEEAVELARVLASLFSTDSGAPSPLIVATLAQWLDERPGYQQSMAALAGSADWAVQQINKMLGLQPAAVVSGPPRTSAQMKETGASYYSDPTRWLWARLPLEGRRLMAAAILLILVLDPPADTLPAPVAELVSRLGTVLRDFPGEIEKIRKQILAKQ